MGIQGPYKVEADEQFPFGHGVVGGITQSRDYNRSTADHPVQEIDEVTGHPVWVVDVMDFDPEARERTFRVKIAAPVQPVPPDEAPGVPVRPVHLDGLTIRTYPKEAGTDRRTKQTRYTMGFTVWATGLSEPRFGAKGSSSSPSTSSSSSSSSGGSSASSGSGSKAA
jgi:hypothetical protein